MTKVGHSPEMEMKIETRRSRWGGQSVGQTAIPGRKTNSRIWPLFSLKQ